MMLRRPFRIMSVLSLALVINLCPIRAEIAAPSTALDQVPKDAQFVLVVSNLQGLSSKLAKLATQLHLPIPDMADALGSFKREFGMTQGINDDGTLLLVVPDLVSAITNKTEPAFVMLVPVTDYDAFVGNFEGKTQGDLTALAMPGGQPGFAKSLGSYAVIGPDEIVIESYTPGHAADALVKKAGTLGARYLTDSDLAIYVDIEAIAPALKPMMQEALDGMQHEVDRMAQQGTDPSQIQMIVAMSQLYGKLAHLVLDGASIGVESLDLSDAGIGMTGTLQTKAGSELAKYIPAGSAKASQLLAMLPDQPYLFAMSMDTTSLDLAGMMAAALDAIPEDGDMAKMMAIYKEAIPMIQQMRGSASVLYVPNEQAMMTGGFLNALNIYDVKDGPDFVKMVKDYIVKLNGMSIPMGPTVGDQPAAALSYTTTYTDNALQLEGLQIDQYQITTVFPPEMMAQMGQMTPIMMMMGNGYNGYLAAKGNTVIATSVLDPQLMTAGLAAASANTGLGSRGVIADQRAVALPEHLVAQGYVSISGIAQTANMFAPMMGMPPIVVPDDLAPLAGGVGAVDDGIAIRCYLPIPTVEFLVDTAMQFQGMMNAPHPGHGAGSATDPSGPPAAP